MLTTHVATRFCLRGVFSVHRSASTPCSWNLLGNGHCTHALDILPRVQYMITGQHESRQSREVGGNWLRQNL